MSASAEFRLSITRALGDQLTEALGRLIPTSMDPQTIRALEDRPGIYQLFENGSLVYIGKAEESLSGRLSQHWRKLSGRMNVGRMAFTCLYVDEDLHAVAPERLLIKHFRSEGQVPWNNNGFGNKDPGKERDTTVVKSGHFDHMHPVNLEWVCEHVMPGAYASEVLLGQVKDELPYLFRYEAADFHKDVTVTVRDATPTADELFAALGAAIAAADPRWQITVLPGYVIMYPKKGPYPSARAVYP